MPNNVKRCKLTMKVELCFVKKRKASFVEPRFLFVSILTKEPKSLISDSSCCSCGVGE